MPPTHEKCREIPREFDLTAVHAGYVPRRDVVSAYHTAAVSPPYYSLQK